MNWNKGSNRKRLLQIITAGTKVESEGLVTESIHRYIEEISAVDESEVRLRQMGMLFDRDKGAELLRKIYEHYFWKYAIEILKDTSDLDAEPRWKEIAIKVLEEYAKMDTN